MLVVASGNDNVEQVTELDRQKGYFDHKKRIEEFDQQRQAGLDAVKKHRLAWEQYLHAAVRSYKKIKTQEERAPDEAGPDFQNYLKNKHKEYDEAEIARIRYVIAQQKKLADVKARLISEEEELGLAGPITGAEPKAKPVVGSGAGAGVGSGSAGSPGSNPVPRDEGKSGFVPPNSGNQGGPDVFEPEIPPPPQMPMDSFDESIPPPIFDEPEF